MILYESLKPVDGGIALLAVLPRLLNGAVFGFSCLALGYVLNSFFRFLAPAMAMKLGPSLLLPGFLAGATLCLWLIARGVNMDKRNQGAVAR